MILNWVPFQIRVPGKWVLAGEHSVLRGGTAVALPHPEFGLELEFEPRESDRALQIFPAAAGSVVSELIDSVAEKWEENDRSFSKPRGHLSIRSTIPIGAGLGSSAALCTAIGKWMTEPLALDPTQCFEFATQLEHRFHGRSSGMDVAVIQAAEPISFVMGRGGSSLGVHRIPHFTFHDTGLRTRTSECVVKVDQLREEDPILAMKIDETMGNASRLALEGLIQFDRGQDADGLANLARSMEFAHECFYSWELVPGAAKRLREDLMRQGALAVKMTGAGGGGFLVALWK